MLENEIKGLNKENLSNEITKLKDDETSMTSGGIGQELTGGGFRVKLTKGKHHVSVYPVTQQSKRVLLQFLADNGCVRRYKYLLEGQSRSAKFTSGLFDDFVNYCCKNGLQIPKEITRNLILSSDDDTEEA